MTVKRKGARRMSEIPADVLAALNAGEYETANLVEWLALDQRVLLANVLREFRLQRLAAEIEADIDQIKKPTAMSLVRTIGVALARLVKVESSPRSAFVRLSRHRSDIVRSWAAYIAPLRDELDLAEKLAATRPFAADPHFGVREIAWMSIRPAIAADLPPAIAILTTWTAESDPGLRRCASEATRPRGVWCNHIGPLKDRPEVALPLLDPLRSDPSRYVQNSVANWLNDASKTRPDWVLALCKRWSKASPTPATAYIVKRASRSLA
jgi:3-methyladenine DNA glycosylase AlkC